MPKGHTRNGNTKEDKIRCPEEVEILKGTDRIEHTGRKREAEEKKMRVVERMFERMEIIKMVHMQPSRSCKQTVVSWKTKGFGQ